MVAFLTGMGKWQAGPSPAFSQTYDEELVYVHVDDGDDDDNVVDIW